NAAGVDAELVADRHAADRVALTVDFKCVLLRVAVPHHHEVSGRIMADRGRALLALCLSVDPELCAERRAAARVALAEDSEVIARASECPQRDEVPGPVAADRRKRLLALGVSVDVELGSELRAAAREALTENPAS